MKDLWIGKRRSLLGLAGAVVLLVVIITSFMIGRSYGGLTIPTSRKVAPSHSFQPFGVSQLSAPQSPSVPQPVAASAPQNTTAAGSGAASNSKTSGPAGSSDIGPQYLVKTLNIDLQVKDTRKVADNLQAWITRTDPRATTSGTD